MRFGLWLALAISVALNLFFVAKSTSGGRHRPKLGKAALPTTVTATTSQEGEGRQASDGLEQCERDLASCHEAATGLLVTVFSEPPPASAEMPAVTGREASPPRVASQEMTPAVQADALDQVAREQLRERWLEARAEILDVFRAELGDRERLASTTRRDIDRYAEAMGLSEAERAEFRERYGPERDAILSAINPRLTAEDPDYGALLDGLKNLFALEDRTAVEMFGEPARRALRASQLERRTTLLAIAATYADLPWADPITW